MSEPKELSRKDLFYSLLFKLGVAYNYEKAKLKREDIYAIQVENKKVNIRPIKFLKQLFSLDYHCRNTIYEDRNDSNMKNETNYDSEEDLFSNKKVSQASKVTSTSEDVVSSSDLILCTLAICDNFLIQDVFEKMISCQLAVPLIAPIGDHLVFHLWATRTIRKKWVNTLPDASQKTLEGIITNKDMTTISFCRIGETKVSKSKLANTFLSSGQGWPEHSYFLHKDIDSKPKLTNGSIEAIWYCPEGRERENLKNISLIYNLRGNVRKNRKQFAFLLKVSSVLVILMETNDMTSKEIDFFNKAENCHKVLIDFSKTGLPVSKGTKTVIFAAGMNFQALSESISKCIGFIKGNQMSLEAQALFAEKLDMKIDEDEDDGCLRAKHAAKAFIEDIKNYDIEIVKENVVPLQGKLWQDWAKLDKEESRHQFRGATDTQVYSDSLREQKEHLRELQYQTGPSKEVLNFIEEIQNKESRAYFLHWCQMELNEMSERYLPSLLKEYNRSTQNLSALLKKQEGGNTDKNSISDEIKNEKEYLKRLSESFIVASFGIEHIFREFSQIYESCEKHKKNKTARILPKLMAELFLMGQPLEIMDGDTSHIPLDWVMAVFFELKKLLGSATRVFVLSILGIQSSGKSTLLNTLFGSKFAVSSGRCTKGVYLQMLPVKNEYREKMNCDYFIIMDSEGLRSPELAGSFRHDNEIATLVACLANTTIVNFWGQTFSKDMADIMQIIAHAYIRMKEVEIKSSFHLIFAGVQDVTAEERNKLGVSRVMDELNEMILKAARNESCKENLNGLSSIFPLLSVKLEATKIPEFLPTLWQGSMSPPESRYGEITDQIKNSLCKGLTIKQSTGIQSQPLKEFSDRLCNVWEAIKIENFIFGFKNTQAIETFADLQKFYDQEIGKVRSAFYQLSWKIGEASLQEAHLSKDEHQVSISSTFLRTKICTNFVLAVFSSYKYVEKAAKRTLVQKICTFNIDEIDYRVLKTTATK